MKNWILFFLLLIGFTASAQSPAWAPTIKTPFRYNRIWVDELYVGHQLPSLNVADSNRIAIVGGVLYNSYFNPDCSCSQWKVAGGISSITAGYGLLGNGSVGNPVRVDSAELRGYIARVATDSLSLNIYSVGSGVPLFYVVDDTVKIKAGTGGDFINVETNPDSSINIKLLNTLSATHIPYVGNDTLQGSDNFTFFNNQLKIRTTAQQQSATLGSELLSSTGWTSTGWTGSFASGWTHTTGNTSVLSNTLSASIGNYFQLGYTITGRTAGSVTISFGGASAYTQSGGISTSITATGQSGVKATTTAGLVITPTTDFNGTIVISIKQITSGSVLPIIALADSSGTNAVSIRAYSSLTNNISIGKSSGDQMTTGKFNVNLGTGAGQYLTTGLDNTNIGQASGQNQTVARGNTNVGSGSGNSQTLAALNLNAGINAGFSQTTAQSNVNLGGSAGFLMTTGSENTHVGYNSGYSGISASFNSGWGSGTLYNTTGGRNTAGGAYAGYDLTTGTFNLILGAFVQAPTATASGQLNIGNVIYGTNLYQSTTRSSTPTTSGNIGIGGSPSADVKLGLYSTTQGFLPPVMTGAQAEAISSKTEGLMIYANNGNGATITSKGWWGWDGTTWNKLN